MVPSPMEAHCAGPSSDTLPITAPAKVVSRTYPSAPQKEDPTELQRLPRNGVCESGNITLRRSEDNNLEMSRPVHLESSPAAVEVVPTVWEPFMNRFRLLAVCLTFLGNGLSDSAAGALIPYMEKYYDIGYSVVSLIFVGQAIGFIFAAVFLDTLRAKLGRARLLGLGQALLTCAYIPLVAAAPFPVIVCAFFFVGFGIAINVAIGNTFCAVLENSTFMLGLLHGSYGIGGISGPLIATAIVTVAHITWSRYYILTLGIGIITLVLSLWSFWGFEKEQGLAARELERPDTKSALGGMKAAMKLRVVLLGATFIFAYQGAEVSISGWITSFFISARGGDPSSVGYVSAGFWAGITVGRFCLSGPAQKIGERLFVYGMIVGAIMFELLVWWVPNIVGDAVAVSIVGLLLGPVYPCAAALFMRGMTRREALSGMGTISAFGSLGGALAPFITGLLAEAVGTYVLHPIAIALFVIMLLCWYGTPTEPKRTE